MFLLVSDAIIKTKRLMRMFFTDRHAGGINYPKEELKRLQN